MKIRRSLKKSTRQYIIVAVICMVVIGSAAIFTSIIITGQIKAEYQNLIEEANNKIEENQREVYIAKKEIRSGELITSDKIEKKTVFASQPEAFYLTEKGLGKAALIDIPIGTQLIKSMLTKTRVSSELRELEYNVINISSNIVSNDIADIRIGYPNGECYVVLSKKSVLDLKKNSTNCFFWLTEEEIQLMSSAIVDAYLYKGTQLYTAEYIEPGIQKASEVNYTPSLSAINLIKSDPNIVKTASRYLNSIVRKELENRLAENQKQDVSQTDWQTQNNQMQNNPTQNNQIQDKDTTQTTQKTGEEMQSNQYYYEDEVKDKEADREYGE